jgi:hypothetical protein
MARIRRDYISVAITKGLISISTKLAEIAQEIENLAVAIGVEDYDRMLFELETQQRPKPKRDNGNSQPKT